jgi:hypothetical protein
MIAIIIMPQKEEFVKCDEVYSLLAQMTHCGIIQTSILSLSKDAGHAKSHPSTGSGCFGEPAKRGRSRTEMHLCDDPESEVAIEGKR